MLLSVYRFIEENPDIASHFTEVWRYLLPILSAAILLGAIYSLFLVPKRPEVFAKILLADGTYHRLTAWECILGRSRQADLVLPFETVSRLHAVIFQKRPGHFMITDLKSKCGTFVNGRPVSGETPLPFGSRVTLGSVDFTFLPISEREKIDTEKKRSGVRPIPPWTILILLSFVQLGQLFQYCISKDAKYAGYIIPSFLLLTVFMWSYFIIMRLFRIIGFELEIIAFYLVTISLSVTATSYPYALYKQLLANVLGIFVMLFLGFLLKDLRKVQRVRWLMAAASLGLMLLTLALGGLRYGATNWISIGGVSFQPSELSKLCYIFCGSATLDRLFRKRNLWLFTILSGSVMLCLAAMNDYGTAAIFFITFLVISFLRSGDIATLILFSGGAVTLGGMVLIAKPYVWARFSTWRHAWEYASSGGYQQTRTMTAIASGGLFGVGGGNGVLTRVAASDTDLVFGMVCEEYGLIVGLLTIICILSLAFYAIRSCSYARSSFYTIAACSATSMLVFQTALNVFGSVDILPLTGVTFPFVSNGGSSMILSWGLLAFLKATDTRPRASFANAVFYDGRKGGAADEEA